MDEARLKEDLRHSSSLNALMEESRLELIVETSLFVTCLFDVIQKIVRACCSFERVRCSVDVCILTADAVQNTRKNPWYKCHGEMKGTQ